MFQPGFSGVRVAHAGNTSMMMARFAMAPAATKRFQVGWCSSAFRKAPSEFPVFMARLLGLPRMSRSYSCRGLAQYSLYIKTAGKMKTQPWDRLGYGGEQNLTRLTQQPMHPIS